MSSLNRVARGPYAGFDPQRDPYLRRNAPRQQVSYNPDRDIRQDLLRHAGTTLRNFAALTLGLPGDIQDVSRLRDAPRQLPSSEELATRFGGDVTHPSWLPASLVAPGPGELKTAGSALAKVGSNIDPMWAMTLFHGTKDPRALIPRGSTTENIRDIFNPQYIGDAERGEGVTAFGHGLYFAESPDVAKSYSPRDFDAEEVMYSRYKQAEAAEDYEAMEVWERAMMHDTGDEIRDVYRSADYDDSMRATASAIADEVDELARQNTRGALFEVEIPDEVTDRMLDWHKPLSEHSEEVRDFAAGVFARESGITPDHPNYADMVRTIRPQLDSAGKTGQDLYESLVTQNTIRQRDAGATVSQSQQVFANSQEAASDALRQAGIPGIKYRAGSLSGGAGDTDNIVLFDPEDITRVKRDSELVYER